MITYYHRTVKDSLLKQINEFRVGSWVYVENPDEEEINHLVHQLSLKEGHIKDALDPYEVPRFEAEGSTLYVFTRLPAQVGNEIATVPLLVLFAENFVAIITKEPLPFLEKIINEKGELYTTQKTKFFLRIFSEITGSYNTFLTSISRRVRRMRVGIEKIGNKDVAQFVAFENTLNDFLSALIPTDSILQKLLTGKNIALYESDKEIVEDLSLNIGQLIGSCKSNMRTIVNIREAYSAILTNNLNRVIKLLTALTIVLTIPTIIASLYGMNVTLPLAESPQAFFWVLGFSAVISLFILALFFKKEWL